MFPVCNHRLLTAAKDAARIDARQHRQPKSTNKQQLETVDASKLSTSSNEHQLQQPGKTLAIGLSCIHSIHNIHNTVDSSLQTAIFGIQQHLLKQIRKHSESANIHQV